MRIKSFCTHFTYIAAGIMCVCVCVGGGGGGGDSSPPPTVMELAVMHILFVETSLATIKTNKQIQSCQLSCISRDCPAIWPWCPGVVYSNLSISITPRRSTCMHTGTHAHLSAPICSAPPSPACSFMALGSAIVKNHGQLHLFAKASKYPGADSEVVRWVRSNPPSWS